MDWLEEKTLESKLLYKGSLTTLRKDKVLLPNKNTSYREYITHPGAVVILPILKNQNVILIRQYRYALRKVFIEVPAGKIDPEEEILSAANRELAEESGYISADIKHISTFYPCIGYSTEIMHFFVAKDLSISSQTADIDEFVQPFEIKFEDALDLVHDGAINDMKTMLSLTLVKSLGIL